MHFNYIIVGAGSTGCVLANRLSEDPSCRVLLLEAGGEDRHYLIGVPKGFGRLVQNGFAWSFEVEQPRLPDKPATEVWTRGKALGGSSTINGMIYSRGHPDDYEEWAALAGSEWGWEAMRGAFCAIEDHELGANEHRGAGGPVRVTPGKFRYAAAEAMIAAGEQLGLPRKADLNDPDLEGVGYYAHNIKAGRRQSAARTFLRAARHRPNLTIMTNVHVDRVLIDAAKRATGVRCRVPTGQLEFHAEQEVIICAGAILSPKLLQLSGIGPAEVLRPLAIDVIHHSPDVGARMREHLGFAMPHRLLGQRGLNWRLRGVGLALSILQYGLARRGPLAAALPPRTRPRCPVPSSRRGGAWRRRRRRSGRAG